jgi:methyl-accepting chemotaxis protein
MEAGQVMERVAEGAVEDSQSSLQVVASARQQLAGMEQIAQAIASINEAGSQSVGGTRQVEQEVKHLQDLALQLKRMVQAEATE